MPYDPTLPANNAPIVAAELRNQFAGLKTLLDDTQAEVTGLHTIVDNKAPAPTLAPLSLAPHNPPTQADLIAIRDYINALVTQLQVTV
jgi:hypothetical protein